MNSPDTIKFVGVVIIVVVMITIFLISEIGAENRKTNSSGIMDNLPRLGIALLFVLIWRRIIGTRNEK
jgi:hypothetical protein